MLAGCPSAFILSSATATSLSIALLARTSVVVRGGIVLEILRNVKTIVVDKTGTLTLGKLKALERANYRSLYISPLNDQVYP